MLFLAGCAWHCFARHFSEFKDIDYLIITFFASPLKIVTSLFHTQPCLQGDEF